MSDITLISRKICDKLIYRGGFEPLAGTDLLAVCLQEVGGLFLGILYVGSLFHQLRYKRKINDCGDKQLTKNGINLLISLFKPFKGKLFHLSTTGLAESGS
jgi:hypothetical protein